MKIVGGLALLAASIVAADNAASRIADGIFDIVDANKNNDNK